MGRTAPLPIAGLPVRLGVRLGALAFLDEAEAARERMLRHRDDEALHDFRVAVRRLRSLLRAWRPWVSESVKAGDRRRLRALARATGDARDLEVQLAWLAASDLPPDAVPGAQRLRRHLAAGRTAAERAAARAAHQFPAACERLRERLSHYTATVDPHHPGVSETCGQVGAMLALAHSSELRAELDAVRSDVHDAQKAHDARIAGKRLRYLLEPFRDDVSNGKRTITLLKELQDQFGALHDMDVMLGLIAVHAATDRRIDHESADSAVDEGDVLSAAIAAEFDALATHVRTLREQSIEHIRSQWLNGRGSKLLREVDAFAAQLREFAPPSLEIERKYLLRALPRRRKGRTVRRIDQGWLPGERLLERVRRVREADTTTWLRTVKLGHGLVRTEIEEPIDEALFRALWRLTRGRRVSKWRYVFRDGDRVWEIDRFIGRDLVLAEVELESTDAKVEPPDWLARYIIREVTGDPRYENVNLALEDGVA